MIRFTLRIGKSSTQFEAPTNENWLDAIENFDFRAS